MLVVSTVTIVMVERYLESHLLERNKDELHTLAKASLESVRTLESIEVKGEINFLNSFQRLAENFAHAGDFRITYLDANGCQITAVKLKLYERLDKPIPLNIYGYSFCQFWV